jgi:hypothetical protein
MRYFHPTGNNPYSGETYGKSELLIIAIISDEYEPPAPITAYLKGLLFATLLLM